MTDDVSVSCFTPTDSAAVQSLRGVAVGRVGVTSDHGLVLDFGRPIRRVDEGRIQRGERRLATYNADWRLKLPDGMFIGSGDPVIVARAAGKQIVGSVVAQITVDLGSLEVSVALGASLVRIFPAGYQPSGWRNEDAGEPLPYWKLWLPDGAALSIGPGLAVRWSTSRE